MKYFAKFNKSNTFIWICSGLEYKGTAIVIEITKDIFDKVGEWYTLINTDGVITTGDNETVAYIKSQKYIELRRAEYPPLGEQFDMIYWDAINGTIIWKDTITAVKLKFPKN